MPPADQRQLAAEQPSCIQSIAVKASAPFFPQKSFISFHPLSEALWGDMLRLAAWQAEERRLGRATSHHNFDAGVLDIQDPL
jgi:hypothetical protein